MAYLSKYQGTIKNGKIQIDTNGKDFLIREIRQLPYTERKYILSPAYSHEDLKTADFKLRSGSKITVSDNDNFTEDDTVYLILSIF